MVLFSGFMPAANAQLGIVIAEKDEVVRLSDNFLTLSEESGVLSIDDAIEMRREFRWAGIQNPNYGFSESGLWLLSKFTHQTDNTEWVIDLNFSQLDRVDFYLVVDGEVVAAEQQGKFSEQQNFRIPVFEIELQAEQPADLYIRIESDSSSLIAPVKVRTRDEHSKAMLVDSIMWGLFYGGLMILAIYNLVLFFDTKENSLLAYVGYISTVLIWQFIWGGHIHLLVENGVSPWLLQHTGLIFIFVGISSGIFSLSFLNTVQNAPRSHLLVVLMLYTQAALAVISLLNVFPPAWFNGAVYGVAILSVTSYLIAGFEAYANRFQPARYYMFAWGLLSIGAIIGMLSLIGVLPSNRFTAYCFQVGVFLEAGLFSVALMDKSRSQLEQEVEQATNDLVNNMELIEEQNVRLDIARKDAIKASNVKSQFLANMSHEIRTPLNAILGFSRELSHASLSIEKQDQVRIINSAADSLLNIVNDVLDFSKIEAGKLELNNQPFSPNHLFEEIVGLMSKSAHQKNLEFIFDLGPLPDKLIGDVYRIKQILNNLLGNAIKFTSKGSVTFSVHGKPLAHGMFQLLIKVEDTGIGISRHDRKKLFNAFSQVDDAINRSYQGTGLGLVISQELVKLMRGQINLQSTPGQGSCFSISVNMNQLSNRFFLSPRDEWRDKQVVIYDPTPETRIAAARMLKLLGADVTSVDSLGFLSTLETQLEHVDYLFACLPQNKLEQRNDVLSHLLHFKAGKRVLLYSGPDPFNHYPSLSQHFNTQLRMPLTPNKIDGLLRAPQLSDRNPMQARLEALPRVKVLAVDDMDMNLKLIETWLSDTPLSLTLCSNGADALALCEKEAFDIILMDVQMPMMDGLQATKLIRKTDLNIGTPIIAVTAHAFKEEQERLMASGMDDYLPKPIELSQLVELINNWCEEPEEEEIHLPSMDWQLALRRAHNNTEAAVELMASFVQQLPQAIESIETCYQQREFGELQHQVHRIHGASTYTGASKFQAMCDEIESLLKRRHYADIQTKLPALVSESEIVVVEGNKLLKQHSLVVPGRDILS